MAEVSKDREQERGRDGQDGEGGEGYDKSSRGLVPSSSTSPSLDDLYNDELTGYPLLLPLPQYIWIDGTGGLRCKTVS